MSRHVKYCGWAALVLLIFSNRELVPQEARTSVSAQTPSNQSPLFVGLRRSSYGLRRENADDAFWIIRAKSFAGQFSGSQATILEIVSNYQDDGSTEIEFGKPPSYRGSTTAMNFKRGNKLDHERALSAYDRVSIKTIVQFEPGDADVGACFELAHNAFAQHPCVIGLGIDAEWLRTKQSKDQTGLPISDADAQQWMEQVLRFNTNWILVLKHFEPNHLPQHYRHPNLWFLTDSQEFASQADWMTNMREWATAFKNSPLGSQYGYPKDQKWWSKNPFPPIDLGAALEKGLPQFRMLLWVDFSANKVKFGRD